MSKIDLTKLEKMDEQPPPTKYELEGIQAYKDKKVADDNPYPVGTDEHNQWRSGWFQAEFFNQEEAAYQAWMEDGSPPES